jgi:hypothetical protein
VTIVSVASVSEVDQPQLVLVDDQALCAEGAVDAAFTPREFVWSCYRRSRSSKRPWTGSRERFAADAEADFDGRHTVRGCGAVAANAALDAEVLAGVTAA